jgi:hypothetical protein
VTKQEWNWIKCSGYEKWLKPTSIMEATTVLIILENRQEHYQEERKKESHSDTDFRLLYLINSLFATNLLFYILLYVGQFSPRLCLIRPFAYLCNFYCCQ